MTSANFAVMGREIAFKKEEFSPALVLAVHPTFLSKFAVPHLAFVELDAMITYLSEAVHFIVFPLANV